MSKNVATRKAYSSHLSREINSLAEEIKKEDPSPRLIKNGLVKVQQKFDRFMEISTTIQDEIDDESQIAGEVDKVEEVRNKVILVQTDAEFMLEKLKINEEKQNEMVVLQQPKMAVKLPDAKIPDFDGNYENFQSFIESFTALVDNNTSISDVEKFGYLRGVCKLDIVQHCSLTSDNYKISLKRLKEEYGDTDLIAKKHLNALLNMNKRKKPTNHEELQEFYNFLYTKMACLEALKKPISDDSQLLIAMITRQVPEILQNKIAKSDSNGGGLAEVMDIIKDYLKKEKHKRFIIGSDSDSENEMFKYKNNKKYNNDYDEEGDEPFSSAAAFPVLNRTNMLCIYCNRNHSPLQCHIVTDIHKRKEIIMNSKRCYNCLKTGHRVIECKNLRRCSHCERKHHSSICEQNKQYNNQMPLQNRRVPHDHQQSDRFQQNYRPSNAENQNQNPTSHHQGVTTASSWESSNSILLQMARAKVKKRGVDKYEFVNIFFDTGSQWSYCTTRIKESLNLEPLHKDIPIKINTFGCTASRVVNSDIVTLQISKGRFTKEITVHTTDSICNPLPSFKISRTERNELRRRKITLADPSCMYDGAHDISIMIGADLYYEFVECNKIKTSGGITAIKSKLGWLLSGPVFRHTSPTNSSVHLVTTEVLDSLSLDNKSINKDWLNQIGDITPQFNYLHKLEVVKDGGEIKPKPQKATQMFSKDNEINNVNCLSSNTGISAHINSQKNPENTDSCQPYTSSESLSDWNQNKLQNSVNNRSVNLDWFWEIEHIGIIPEEKEPSVWEEFKSKIKYHKDSRRYEVVMPCKMELLESLPDNYHLSEVRLQSLLKKLNKPCNKELLKSYNDIIKNQLEDGIIEEINPNKSVNTATHYLSHHCVVREDKSSTKVRMVLDGSAKANKNSISLNSCLQAGPSLVNNLASVLLRFRMYKIGITADISKAFHQLLLTDEDRDLTRFLWKEEGKVDNPLKVFRFKRVPFGLTPSPFLLHATIIHHLERYKDKYPKIIEMLLLSFYVDDLLTGEDNEKDAVELINVTNDIMKDASMELRKWSTNCPTILETCYVSEENTCRDEQSIKILGMIWDKNSDEFRYCVGGAIEFVESLKPTKRSVLKIIQKIYDPLGILSPYVIAAKIFLQSLCKLNLTWDEHLPEDLMNFWTNWCRDIYEVCNINISRCVNEYKGATLELIGFCDASEKAYAAVIYIITNKNSSINSKIMIAKSRVAPMKQMTIPRLELLGAVLLARLMSTVKKILSTWEFKNITYYTDSTNVLYWIKDTKGTRKWTAFITRRLEEIYTMSSKDQWKYCRGDENPADLPTRGIAMNKLSECRTWFNGPKWLTEAAYCTNDISNDSHPSKECLNEEIKQVNTHIVSVATGIDVLLRLENFSNLQRLYRVTGYVYMFYKIHVHKEMVSHFEMRRYAEKQWIKNEQKKYYGEVISFLKGEINKPKPSIKNQIDLFLDNEDIIRCTGRFKYAPMSDEVKFPILLPKDSHLTKLIIEDKHKLVKHSGVQTTLLEVRENFWIPKGRRLVKTIIYGCLVCRRLNAKPYKPPVPPPLPAIRLSDMPAFTHTGVDFAGPVFLREDCCKIKRKGYIAIFTCASVRAVHLELVPSLSSESFKNSLSRFVSTRGVPSIIISDNAKTFKKTADDYDCEITRSPTKEYIESKNIHWLFYLEKSPWWGGFIERMVGSVKTILRKILHHTLLRYDDMTALLKEVESVINSRPITYIYSDEMVEPLTPSDMLIGKRSTKLPEDRSYINDSDNRNKYRERIVDNFKLKWGKLYLSELQDHHIVTSKKRKLDIVPQIGEIVIIKDLTPRTNWKLGKVTNLYKSRDGNIRSVEIMKPNRNIIRRPPQLLIPLEQQKQN